MNHDIYKCINQYTCRCGWLYSNVYRRKVYHHRISLCILVYQASAVCLLHTMGHWSGMYIILCIIVHIPIWSICIAAKFIIIVCISKCILVYQAPASPCVSLYIRPLQPVYCTQWDIVFSPFQSRHHAPFTSWIPI